MVEEHTQLPEEGTKLAEQVVQVLVELHCWQLAIMLLQRFTELFGRIT